MFVLKNRIYPKLQKANFHARLCLLQQLLKNIYRMMLAIFWFTGEKICTVTTPKIWQNDRLYAYRSTKKKDRDKTPAHTISFQLVRASVGE